MGTLPMELSILLGLILANGFFAMAEIAMVSVRRERLRMRAEKGDAGARAALELAESPNRFLSTVQIGITLIGVVAGVFGGATLAEDLAGWLAGFSIIKPYSQQIALTLVVGAITYLSLVIGELAPKRIGLSYAEFIACRSSRFMTGLARLVHPLVRILGGSTDLLLRLLPLRSQPEETVSEDEIKGLMREGLRAGAFNRVESEMVSNVLDLDRLVVRDIMTPRPKIIWLSKDDTHESIWHKIVVSRHSQFPVYEGTRDNVVGVVSVKSIYANLAAGVPVKLGDLMRKPLIVPETQPVPKLLETFRQTGTHVALATNEFGTLVGMVTLIDVMEAVIGDLPSPDDRGKPDLRLRPDGTWLADALVDIVHAEEVLPGFRADPEAERDYQTLGGYVVKLLGRVPKEGDLVETPRYLFEVLDMDRLRVDKILITRSPASVAGGETKGPMG
jgi:putative hemolysin